MKRFEAIRGFMLVLVAVLWAGGVLAEDEVGKVPLRVTVTHLSEGDGGVDPKARALIGALDGANISYPEARVVREVKLDLAPGDAKSVSIGNGRKAHLQLMQADKNGALVAVDIEGGLKVDARVGRGKRPLVLDAGKVGDGKRVISIEVE